MLAHSPGEHFWGGMYRQKDTHSLILQEITHVTAPWDFFSYAITVSHAHPFSSINCLFPLPLTKVDIYIEIDTRINSGISSGGFQPLP